MAVHWLKGLVAPAAEFVGAAPPAQPDAPPVGGGPNPYGVVPAASGPGAGAPPGAGAGAPPPFAGMPPSQWSTGTRTQGAGGQGAPGATAGSADRVATLEARCAELAHDVASLALFARSLLTLLEERNVVTRAQFLETKNRLDALDGKFDDR